MPFHVEVSSSLRHARAFNLDAEELRRAIIDPWVADRPIRLGDRDWQPRHSGLKILEGPALDPPQLSFGQGWANAQRRSEDVTRRELAAAGPPPERAAFVFDADSFEEALAELAAGHQPRPLSWSEASSLVAGGDPEIAALILVRRRREAPTPEPAPEQRSER